MHSENDNHNHIIEKVLNGNMRSNHHRLALATVVLMVLMFIITSWLEWQGLATPAVSFKLMFTNTFIAFMVLLFAIYIKNKFSDKKWTKWFMVTAIFLVMIIMRTIPNDAPESHVMFYLVMVLSILYLDIALIFYCIILCIAGDLLLQHYYPLLVPEGTFVGTLLVRYFFYVCVGIAAAIGISTFRELLSRTITLEVANLKLIQDNQRKTRMEQLRIEFIAAVSHELKSPLSIIQGYTEALKDSLVTDQEREIFGEIVINEVNKMGNMVSEMMEMAKLETGYTKINQEPFYINKLISYCLKPYAKSLKEKNITLTIDGLDKDLLVMGEGPRIEIVVANFLENALRYTPVGGEIKIKVKQHEKNARISIENETEHIKEHEINSIWEPFYRAEKSRSRDFGGHGLGLAICRTLLSLHHSNFGVINTSTGVMFYFTLTIE